MARFLIGWAVISVGIGIYMRKKNIELKVNRDVLTLILALLLTSFFLSIQWIFETVVNLIF